MIKNLIKRIVYPCLGLSVPNRTINVYKTLIFNLLAFGVKGLFKLPVYIYYNTNICKVGKIVLHCPMRRGLVKIGELDYKSQGTTKFHNNGAIEIYGPVKIEGGTILDNSGVIEFHGYNRISESSMVLIREKLVIGEQSRIGFHSFIMDSDDHYTIDVETRQVKKNRKEIVIGRYNWMASNTYIKKGVRTPDYLIVASANALLTKDYTDLPPYSVIGGSPAKLLKTGVRRIYNTTNEKKMSDYFKKENKNFVVDKTIELGNFCSQY